MAWLDIQGRDATFGTNGATSGVTNQNQFATGDSTTIAGPQLPTDPKIWLIIAVGVVLAVRAWRKS